MYLSLWEKHIGSKLMSQNMMEIAGAASRAPSLAIIKAGGIFVSRWAARRQKPSSREQRLITAASRAAKKGFRQKDQEKRKVQR